MKERESDLLERAIQTLRTGDQEGADAFTKARVSARLTQSIAALGQAPSLEHDGESLGTGSAPEALLGQGVLGIARSIAPTLIAFTVGGAVGAGVHASLAQRAPEVIYVDRPPSPAPRPPKSVAPPLPLPAEPARPASSREGSHERPRSKSRAPVQPEPESESVSLAEQQALLDQARAALARGRNEVVLDALKQHAHRYPASELEEEREAITIKALVGAGRQLEARERGARFKSRFPNSLLLPSVSDALGGIP